ncbi:uncharacterized protein LOC143913958 [Arctopsyche grandis]|uniref:uncharacterized protein LOC143913958 n=1 Tax=Arctopsyche grandis TaxID=121162 RepID=UPI00406D6844
MAGVGAEPLLQCAGVLGRGAQPTPNLESPARDEPTATPTPAHVVQEVKATFARLYRAVRLREMQTLHQLELAWTLRPSHSPPPKQTPLNLHNESQLLEEISKFATIDLHSLHLKPNSLPENSNHTFSDENVDGLHCIGCGKLLLVREDSIEESSEVSSSSKNQCENNVDNESKVSCESMLKLNPTQDWLNQIICETETEPSQIVDLMEHSAIECS